MGSLREVKMEDLKKAWNEEYKRKGIPSSFRKDATTVVVEFIQWIKRNNSNIGNKAADIGCGQGRNSFYLASNGFRVTGIELLEENAKLVNAGAKREGLAVEAFAQDAAEPWPIPVNSLDIAIDVFCYKHIVNKEKQAHYRYELWKALKQDGYYFISLASEHDGFYGPLLEKSTCFEEKLIVDPYSDISSFLYSMDDLAKEFSDYFELVQINEKHSTSPMYGKEYSRVVINAIFKRKKIG
jgi:SAM-dependent methyltransferase